METSKDMESNFFRAVREGNRTEACYWARELVITATEEREFNAAREWAQQAAYYEKSGVR